MPSHLFSATLASPVPEPSSQPDTQRTGLRGIMLDPYQIWPSIPSRIGRVWFHPCLGWDPFADALQWSPWTNSSTQGCVCASSPLLSEQEIFGFNTWS